MINFARTASLKVGEGGHERTCAETLLISTSILYTFFIEYFLIFSAVFLDRVAKECFSLEL